MNATRAFTLIEIMVVIAIMVLVASFASPAINGILKGSQLTQAGQTIIAQLGLARQTAITQNRNVEVRFYKCGDPSLPNGNSSNPSTWKFRGLQAFVISDSGALVALSKAQYLPPGTIMDSGATLSSIFDSGKRISKSTPPLPIPRINTNYSYFTMRFRPDGSTDLSTTSNGSSQSWYLTVHNASDGDALNAPPHNFWTIQIESINGTVMNYRP